MPLPAAGGVAPPAVAPAPQPKAAATYAPGAPRVPLPSSGGPVPAVLQAKPASAAPAPRPAASSPAGAGPARVVPLPSGFNAAPARSEPVAAQETDLVDRFAAEAALASDQDFPSFAEFEARTSAVPPSPSFPPPPSVTEVSASFDDVTEVRSLPPMEDEDVDVDLGGPTPRVVEAPGSLDLGEDLGVAVPAMAPPPTVNRVLPAPSAPRAPPVISAVRDEPLEVLDPAAPVRPTPVLDRANKKKFQIRRASGKIFGPFDEERVARMLVDGELAGTESVKTEEGDWQPILSVEVFAAAAPTLPPVAEASARGGAAPLEAARDPDALKRLQQVYGDRMAAMAVVDRVPLAQRVRALLPVILGAAAVATVLAFGLALGATRYGTFGRFLILGPPRTSPGSPASAALAKARAGLRTGSFGALTAGLESAQRAHQEAPSAVDAEGLMAQLAAALARESPGDGVAQLAAVRAPDQHAQYLGPRDPEVVRAKAALELADGKGAAARSTLEALLRATPGDPETLYLAGVIEAPGDRAKAKAFFSRAVASDPKLGKAYLALAGLAVQGGSPSEALTQAQKAAQVDPQQARARLLVQSLEAKERSLGAKPGSARSSPPGTDDELRSLSGEKSGLSPAQRATALALLGEEQIAAGRIPEAEKSLAEALKLDPASRDANLSQGRLLLATHHGGAALAALQKLQPLASKDLEVAYALAEAQIDQGHYPEATAVLGPALAAHPDDPRLATLKGIAAASSGKAEEAESVLAAALEG